MRHQLRFPLVEQLFILTRFAHSSSCSGVKGFHQFPTFQLRICPPLTLFTNGRTICLTCEKSDWYLSQKGQLNPLYL